MHIYFNNVFVMIVIIIIKCLFFQWTKSIVDIKYNKNSNILLNKVIALENYKTFQVK